MVCQKQSVRKKQTSRDQKQPVYKRFTELNAKKTDVLIEMFRKVYQRKIQIDYILFDSWFATMSLILKLLKVNNNCHDSIFTNKFKIPTASL